MNHNYLMCLSYDGTRYSGWQKQGNTPNTIQGKLEAALFSILSETTEVQGSGRTDAGVHAEGQTANFHCHSDLPKEELLRRLREAIPEDIGVLSLEEVDSRFHARLSAKQKTYTYTIWNTELPDVFARRYEWQIPERLDISAMQSCAEHFVGTHDFRSFCSNRNLKKSSVRTIYRLDVVQEGNRIRISATGNGFLYNMVRVIAQTLVDAGKGKLIPEEIDRMLSDPDRRTIAMAPAKGLCLKEVQYE